MSTLVEDLHELTTRWDNALPAEDGFYSKLIRFHHSLVKLLEENLTQGQISYQTALHQLERMVEIARGESRQLNDRTSYLASIHASQLQGLVAKHNPLGSTTPQPPSMNGAVRQFAGAMQSTMAAAHTQKGRYGWWDHGVISDEQLATQLVQHLYKGAYQYSPKAFVDVANYCMMLHWRKASPRVLHTALPNLRNSAPVAQGTTTAKHKSALDDLDDLVREAESAPHMSPKRIKEQYKNIRNTILDQPLAQPTKE